MKFSLLVLGAPYSCQAADSALHFAHAVLAGGHSLHRVFFYHDGVYCANALDQPPQDETSVSTDWSAFAREHNVELVACISSALRRGIVDATEAERYEKSASNLQEGFVLSGLGQWVEACLESDRLVTFGD